MAHLQDELTGALIGLACACGSQPKREETDRLVLESLFTTVTNVNFNEETMRQMIRKVNEEKACIAPGCLECTVRCGNTDPFDMEKLWNAEEDIRSLKSLILFGIRGMAAYAYHAMVLGYTDSKLNDFFYKALSVLSYDMTVDELLPVVMETGKMNLICMELLDRANVESFGTPVPVEVPLSVEKGPFIVVTGHDLHDLKLLLEQTRGKRHHVYTRRNTSGAQIFTEEVFASEREFWDGMAESTERIREYSRPGFIYDRCLMPVKDSFGRVFTTAVVSYPEIVHIDDNKDFTPVIEKALELGGYDREQKFTGINGGSKVTTGFGHKTVLGIADQVVEAVKSGTVRHFFLVGGCDGARTGRNYFTEFVKQTPQDTIVLTLACGKYRFNDLDLGTVGGLPRLMDLGQCNDAYSAIKIAAALADAFECDVNELPLSMVLSWYEQKAVCILLTLLHLGIKNIRLGPTIPAFLSPNVLNLLVENYKIAPVTTPEEDLRTMLD